MMYFVLNKRIIKLIIHYYLIIYKKIYNYNFFKLVKFLMEFGMGPLKLSLSIIDLFIF